MYRLLPVATLVASLTLLSCYSTRAAAPQGQNVSLAGPMEACAETHRTRAHYLLLGLVGLGDPVVLAAPNSRVRIIAEADPVDVLLRIIGYGLTFGLYGGSQSIIVETCYGAAGPPAAGAQVQLPANAPSGVTVQVPSVTIGVDPAPAPRQRAPLERGLPYCKNTVDCGSGEFCKDRGDGIRLCMGDNARGDYCHSTTDCGSGMFCKGRGDGLKVCM